VKFVFYADHDETLEKICTCLASWQITLLILASIAALFLLTFTFVYTTMSNLKTHQEMVKSSIPTYWSFTHCYVGAAAVIAAKQAGVEPKQAGVGAKVG